MRPNSLLIKKQIDGNLDWQKEPGRLFWKRARKKINVGDEAGTQRRDGRWVFTFNRRMYLRSRIVFLMFKGWLPTEIDHKDRNVTNDHPNNLREASSSQNKYNTKIMSNNISGTKGVHFWHRAGKWQAFINVNGKRHHLGTFSEKDDAIKARQMAEEAWHGQFRNPE